MSDNNDHGAPGRSLLAEMTELRHQMTNLRREVEDIRKAMGMLVDLQREVALKVEAALTQNPITVGETPVPVV